MPVRRHPMAVSAPGVPLRALALDIGLIARLKTTYDLVRVPEGRLAEIFYARLFAAAPQLRPMFRGGPEAQAAKLTEALDAVVRNLERPAENASMIAELGKRHAVYGAKPEHYDLVIDLLVDSMRQLLGPSQDPRRTEEWRIALRLISDQMIAAGNLNAGPHSGGSASPRAPG